MANINCAPIESYADEIKHCAQEMILLGELFLNENEKSVRISNGRSVYSYSLKSNTDDSQGNAASQKVYFSSSFIRWQHSHQVSDEYAQEKLDLTSDEFHQFREDELNISENLIAKLAEVTGSSLQFWQKNFGKTYGIRKVEGVRKIMKTFKTVTTQKITALVCDGCGLEANADDYEFHEFISVNHHCGYGSIHGDGNKVEVDLCQQCFADMCGDTLRVTDESNAPTKYSKSTDKVQLAYSNIFDVICQSKTKAHQLKQDCDLKLAVRDILTKNKVADNNELTIALRRVEQLWDAQYLSAEGNELHQLADLICAYEKKGWNSFFEEAPLASDDFMPERLDFKSTFTFDEKKTDSDILSTLSLNTIDDTKRLLLVNIISTLAKHPELRLGQLLANAMSKSQQCTELFYVEDKTFAEKIKQLYL